MSEGWTCGSFPKKTASKSRSVIFAASSSQTYSAGPAARRDRGHVCVNKRAVLFRLKDFYSIRATCLRFCLLSCQHTARCTKTPPLLFKAPADAGSGGEDNQRGAGVVLGLEQGA